MHRHDGRQEIGLARRTGRFPQLVSLGLQPAKRDENRLSWLSTLAHP